MLRVSNNGLSWGGLWGGEERRGLYKCSPDMGWLESLTVLETLLSLESQLMLRCRLGTTAQHIREYQAQSGSFVLV